MSMLWWWNICYDMIWYAIECNVLFNKAFRKIYDTWAGCDDGIYVMIWYDML